MLSTTRSGSSVPSGLHHTPDAGRVEQPADRLGSEHGRGRVAPADAGEVAEARSPQPFGPLGHRRGPGSLRWNWSARSATTQGVVRPPWRRDPAPHGAVGAGPGAQRDHPGLPAEHELGSRVGRIGAHAGGGQRVVDPGPVAAAGHRRRSGASRGGDPAPRSAGGAPTPPAARRAAGGRGSPARTPACPAGWRARTASAVSGASKVGQRSSAPTRSSAVIVRRHFGQRPQLRGAAALPAHEQGVEGRLRPCDDRGLLRAVQLGLVVHELRRLAAPMGLEVGVAAPLAARERTVGAGDVGAGQQRAEEQREPGQHRAVGAGPVLDASRAARGRRSTAPRAAGRAARRPAGSRPAPRRGCPRRVGARCRGS